MEDVKTEPVDFVRDFQEYLTQQTQHVNMISGSVCGGKGSGEPFRAVALRSDGDGPQPPSAEVGLSLEDGPDGQMESLERTSDGKYKCGYCNYANKGMARLIEHTRIHTGEKPHRCQLCQFASAYERHLEAHMRSHTGEKPYKCDLCAFRCSDRSNLSHHRRRRHKLPPARVLRCSASSFAAKRMLTSLQKRTGSLGFGRRLHLNLTPAEPQRSDYLTGLSPKVHRHPSGGEYDGRPEVDESDARGGGADGLTLRNPLDQLSALAGQLADLHPETRALESPGEESSSADEKPILIEQVSGEHVAVQTSALARNSPPSLRSPAPDLGFESDALTAGVGAGRPSTPAPGAAPTDGQLSHKCQHCDVHFLDVVLYTIHMGCHGYERPFQCNVCGHACRDQYDFACHFALGQHRK